MTTDGVTELRMEIADMAKAQAVHYERMENGQERMLEKLDEAVKAVKEQKPAAPYRNGNGGISPKFVLQIIGILLAAGILLGSGQKGVDAVAGIVSHIMEAKK